MRSTIAVLITLISLAISAPPAAWAGDGNWTSTGPFGGPCRDVVIDPTDASKVYAACSFGVFRSLNGGSTWEDIGHGLTSLSADALAIDPTTPSTLYLSSTPGVFKSTNSGATWTLSFEFISGFTLPACALLIDPTTPSTVYAGFCLSFSGIVLYKTTNGGSDWAQVGVGIPGARLNSLRTDPNDSSVLLATTNNGPAYRSTDGGVNFSALGGGTLPPVSGLDIVVDPADSSNLYVGTSQGIYKSTDTGASFAPITDNSIQGEALVFDPSSPGKLYALTQFVDDPLRFSTDGGSSWTPVSSFPDRTASLLATSPASPATRIVGSTRGLLRSLDGDATWALIDDRRIGTTCNGPLAADPVAAQTVYCSAGAVGLFKSVNGGESWSAINNGLDLDGSNGIFGVVVDPQTPQTLYATLNFDVLRSLDGGLSWTQIGGPTANALSLAYVDPTDSDVILATSGSPAIWRSEDGGMSWNPSVTGIPAGTFQALFLKPDPSDASVAYSGFRNSGAINLFKSSDHGVNWSPVSGAPLNVNDLAVDPENPMVLYVGSAGEPFYKSIDGGVTFTPSSTGIVGNNVQKVVVSPRDNSTLYASTFSEGVFKSTDAGATWASLEAGPFAPFVPEALRVRNMIHLPNQPETLVAATLRGIHTLTPTLFADGFESGETTSWSVTVP